MFQERITALSSILEEGQAALITSGVNRLYFTGFNSSAGTVLITKSSAFLIIDFRYFEKAKATVKHMQVILQEKLFDQITEILKKENINTVLVESDSVTLSLYSRFCEELPDFNISKEDILSRKIESLRSIKSSEELKLIKKSQALTDMTFSYILDRISEGRTEKEVMLDMEFFMRKNGSESVAFDFIVVSGKNSSLPHGVPTDKRIEKGDFITMDFGAVVGGYRSDMTRTVAVGFADDLQKEIYSTVLKAQTETIKFIKSGVKCCDVDKVARDIITDAGYGDCFGHGLGHSVGLEIHENPACNTRDETLLTSGMIMTVEPGIYIENKFGVRIEDMVFVTENGNENLTKSPKELIIL
ncbi:MAG: aminopeptidase P family protein [Clostridia bacterium]|nr:aminopeptidase P family protein [Clostridia bacterium]